MTTCGSLLRTLLATMCHATMCRATSADMGIPAHAFEKAFTNIFMGKLLGFLTGPSYRNTSSNTYARTHKDHNVIDN